MLRKFSLAHYRFTLTPSQTINLHHSHQGISIRGAFGTAFKKLCCCNFANRCNDCPQQGDCPYALVFEPTIPPQAKRLRLNNNIPRPFVIKPPRRHSHSYSPGEKLQFELVITGNIKRYLSYFIISFASLAEEGMGSSRSKFSLNRVSALSDSQEQTIYEKGEEMLHDRYPTIDFQQISKLAQKINPHRVTIHFRTPTILKVNGQIVRRPEFHHLIKRLRDRINALAHFYCDDLLAVDYKQLGEEAESVKRVGENFHWTPINRYSSKRRIWHELSGFTGHGVYEGELRPYLPLLVLGQYLHVGKGAAFGNGWMEVS